MTLIITYIFKSSHVEHVDSPIVRTRYYLSFCELQTNVHCPRMILNRKNDTDAKEADLAIFLTPEGGILCKFYTRALGLAKFDEDVEMLLLL